MLGLGRMGRVHARAIHTLLPDVRLAAIAEPRVELVAAAADVIGSAAVYARAAEAVRHPGLDGCVVVTPTDTHAGVVAAALDAGLHVFCEKPLTLDAAESEALGDRAAELGVTLQVGFWRRFCRPLVEARELLRQGAIGHPVFLRLSQWDVDCPPREWCDPIRSGGIFVDMGIHEFDEIEWLLDTPIAEVEGYPLPVVEPGFEDVGDLDNALVVATNRAGVRAVVDLSRNGRYTDDVRLEILGSDGALFVHTHPAGRVTLGTRAGLTTVWQDEPGDVFLEGIASELAAFSLRIAGAAVEVPGAAESARALMIAETARDSAISRAGAAPSDPRPARAAPPE